jgi:hypothetical protein
MADDRIIPVGPGETYTNLLAALVGEAADITVGTGTDERLIFDCANFEDTTGPAFGTSHVSSSDGWTTDYANDNYILIRATTSHGGIFGHTAAYRLVRDRTFAGVFMVDAGIDVVLEGITIVQTAAAGNQSRGVLCAMAAGQRFEMLRCLVDYTGTGTLGGDDQGVRINGNVAYTLRVRNTYVRGFSDGIAFGFNQAATIVLDNNNCIDNAGSGISAIGLESGSTLHLRNNLLVGEGTNGDYESVVGDPGTVNSDTNITEDASSPEGASFQGSRPTFVNEGAGDYHLDADDTVAKGRGTDLSADATWAHNEDIDGEAQTGDWDIGADQVVVAFTEVGLATETDTAFGVGFTQTWTMGLAAEADSAFGVSSPLIGAVGLAAETSSAFDAAHAIARPVGLVVSEESAFTVTAGFSGTVGLAEETDTALAVAGGRVFALTWGTETNTAFGVRSVKRILAGLATETDSAPAVVAQRLRAVGFSAETAEALAVAIAKTQAVGLALETDEARSVAAGGAVPIGFALETETAFSLVHSRAVSINLATETAAALGLTSRKVHLVGLSTETDTAFQLVGQSAPIDFVLAPPSMGLRAQARIGALRRARGTRGPLEP